MTEENALIFKMAVRNLSRNKRTNRIICIIMCVGLIFVAISLSFIQGIKSNYEKLILGTIAGDISISTDEETFECTDAKLNKLTEIKGISMAAPRLYSSCFLFHGDTYVTATGIGIDKSKDKQMVSNFSRKGNKFLLKSNSIAITKQLAKEIDVQVGDTIQIVFCSTNAQTEKQDVTISCIYEGKSSNSAIESWTILDIADMRRLMGVDKDTVTTVKAFSEDGVSNIESLKKEVQEQLKNDSRSFTVETWKETSAADMMRTPTIYSAILMSFAGILFVLISIGITSVLFSALLGRVREFGVMQTLGMKKRQIVCINLVEMLIMITISMLIGVVICIVATGAVNAAEIGIASDALKFTFGGNVLTLELTGMNCLCPIGFIYVLSICIAVVAVRKITKIPLLEAMND